MAEPVTWRHNFFLRDPKEDGVLLIEWLRGSKNPVNMSTKNLSGPTFEKCAWKFVGNGEYMNGQVQISE